MAPIIRTCKAGLLAALAMAAATPAKAVRIQPYRPGGLSTYVDARAAGLTGDLRRSATLYAALAAAEPGNSVAADRAIAAAIAGGDMPLALRLARARPLSSLTTEARLLLATDALQASDEARALTYLGKSDTADLSSLQPLIRAWGLAARGAPGAIEMLGTIGTGTPLSAYRDEQRALLLLRLGRIADAQVPARAALAAAGGRENALRLTLADALAAAGDRPAATTILTGNETSLAIARRTIAGGGSLGARIGTPSEALAQVLGALAIDLRRGGDPKLPLALAQVAHFAAPGRADIDILLGLLLGQADRPVDALAAFRLVPAVSPLNAAAHDAEARELIDANRKDEALAMARSQAAAPGAMADDYSRLGDVLAALDRHAEAADAYGRALALVEAGGPGAMPYALHLLRGGELERANRWAQAEPELERALALAPDNPVVLNYLGYARLERGEDAAAAEAMIAKASAAQPDDPSITDSLGWAQFRRGHYDQAIATLTRAAAGDPTQAEIQEHLGDALFASGRRFEARFAWEAARVAADDDTVAARVRGKIANGLPAPAK